VILAAIIVGLVAAYYLGLRAGGLAAAAAALLFLAAQIVPGLALWAYAIVAVGLIGLFAVGPRLPQNRPDVIRFRNGVKVARGAARRLWARYGR
jgi:hypothetical protein